jgi:hypothetical protein
MGGEREMFAEQHQSMTARRSGLLTGLFVTLLWAVSGADAQTVLQSGPERVALLELYTSQGCSSCPPADRWLSALTTQPGLWDRVVPVAFHVDYWDYIGWQDPFARPEYSQRQRRYAREGGVRTVYTPGVMLNGKDWRDWRHTVFPQPRPARTGTLTVEHDGDRLQVRYQPQSAGREDLRITVALLGFDLESEVTAGENRGRKLENDFIVLELKQEPLEQAENGWSVTLPAFAGHPDVSHLALAAWVTEASKQTPLQAVGGWLQVMASKQVMGSE